MENLADPVFDRLAVVRHKQDRVAFVYVAGVFFLAIDDYLDHTLLRCRRVVAAVLIATAGAHSRYRHVRFALGETIAFELLHELKQLHPAYIIGYTPERALGWIRDNTCCLSVYEFVVVAKSRFGNFCFVVLFVNLFDGCSHDTVVTRDNGVLKSEIDVSLFIDRTLEEAMRPSLDLIEVICRQHPGVALVERAAVQLHGIAA